MLFNIVAVILPLALFNKFVLSNKVPCQPKGTVVRGLRARFFPGKLNNLKALQSDNFLVQDYLESSPIGERNGIINPNFDIRPCYMSSSSRTCPLDLDYVRLGFGHYICGFSYCQNKEAGLVTNVKVLGFPTTVTNFTLELTGYIKVDVTGAYKFVINAADDVAGISIGGGSAFDCCDNNITNGITNSFFDADGIKNWERKPDPVSADIYLHAGEYYPVRLMYSNIYNYAHLQTSVILPNGKTISEWGALIYNFEDSVSDDTASCTLPALGIPSSVNILPDPTSILGPNIQREVEVSVTVTATFKSTISTTDSNGDATLVATTRKATITVTPSADDSLSTTSTVIALETKLSSMPSSEGSFTEISYSTTSFSSTITSVSSESVPSDETSEITNLEENITTLTSDNDNSVEILSNPHSTLISSISTSYGESYSIDQDKTSNILLSSDSLTYVEPRSSSYLSSNSVDAIENLSHILMTDNSQSEILNHSTIASTDQNITRSDIQSATSSSQGPDQSATTSSQGPDQSTTTSSQGLDQSTTTSSQGYDQGTTTSSQGYDQSATTSSQGPNQTISSSSQGHNGSVITSNPGHDETATTSGQEPDQSATSSSLGHDKSVTTSSQSENLNYSTTVNSDQSKTQGSIQSATTSSHEPNESATTSSQSEKLNYSSTVNTNQSITQGIIQGASGSSKGHDGSTTISNQGHDQTATTSSQDHDKSVTATSQRHDKSATDTNLSYDQSTSNIEASSIDTVIYVTTDESIKKTNTESSKLHSVSSKSVTVTTPSQKNDNPSASGSLSSNSVFPTSRISNPTAREVFISNNSEELSIQKSETIDAIERSRMVSTSSASSTSSNSNIYHSSSESAESVLTVNEHTDIPTITMVSDEKLSSSTYAILNHRFSSSSISSSMSQDKTRSSHLTQSIGLAPIMTSKSSSATSSEREPSSTFSSEHHDGSDLGFSSADAAIRTREHTIIGSSTSKVDTTYMSSVSFSQDFASNALSSTPTDFLTNYNSHETIVDFSLQNTGPSSVTSDSTSTPSRISGSNLINSHDSYLPSSSTDILGQYNSQEVEIETMSSYKSISTSTGDITDIPTIFPASSPGYFTEPTTRGNSGVNPGPHSDYSTISGSDSTNTFTSTNGFSQSTSSLMTVVSMPSTHNPFSSSILQITDLATTESSLSLSGLDAQSTVQIDDLYATRLSPSSLDLDAESRTQVTDMASTDSSTSLSDLDAQSTPQATDLYDTRYYPSPSVLDTKSTSRATDADSMKSSPSSSVLDIESRTQIAEIDATESSTSRSGLNSKSTPQTTDINSTELSPSSSSFDTKSTPQFIEYTNVDAISQNGVDADYRSFSTYGDHIESTATVFNNSISESISNIEMSPLMTRSFTSDIPRSGLENEPDANDRSRDAVFHTAISSGQYSHMIDTSSVADLSKSSTLDPNVASRTVIKSKNDVDAQNLHPSSLHQYSSSTFSNDPSNYSPLLHPQFTASSSASLGAGNTPYSNLNSTTSRNTYSRLLSANTTPTKDTIQDSHTQENSDNRHQHVSNSIVELRPDSSQKNKIDGTATSTSISISTLQSSTASVTAVPDIFSDANPVFVSLGSSYANSSIATDSLYQGGSPSFWENHMNGFSILLLHFVA